MARQKAILLGVPANRPFFSQKISIGEGKRWNCEVTCNPNHVKLTDEIECEVWYNDGTFEKFFLGNATVIVGGATIRVSLLRPLIGVGKLDVMLTEQ